MSDSGDRMRRFWDERAREDAFFFVDNRIGYRDPAAAELFWQLGRRDLDELLGSLDIAPAPGDDVVEIGCGVGRLTRVLAERVATVRALDVSEEMLALARRENAGLANVEWIRGDGVSLAGIADASADVVVSHVVFQHIPDPAITLGYVREIGRVLKPAGVAALQMSNDARVHGWRFTWRDRLKERLGRGPRGQSDESWIGSAVELDDLRRAAADGGLEIEKLVHEGTQYMLVRMRRAQTSSR
jgi:SAM-dependent methyltransferase